jgi:hypothetical protein
MRMPQYAESAQSRCGALLTKRALPLQPFVRSPGFVFQNILEENMRNAVTARQKLLDSESGAGAHQSTVSRLTAMAAMQDTGTDESGDDST